MMATQVALQLLSLAGVTHLSECPQERRQQVLELASTLLPGTLFDESIFNPDSDLLTLVSAADQADIELDASQKKTLADLHAVCQAATGRAASMTLVRQTLRKGVFDADAIKHSFAAKAYSWEGEERDYVDEVYVDLLGYLPSLQDLMLFYEMRGDILLRMEVLENIRQKNDFHYLEECRSDFFSTTSSSSVSASGIHYMGPIGTSGYAKAALELIRGLDDCTFEPIQFHHYKAGDPQNIDVLQSRAHRGIPEGTRYLILHSTPELWPSIARRARRNHPDIVIYGISVWETDTLPDSWVSAVQCVDKMSVPSNFSANAFRKVLSRERVDVVHHPLAVAAPPSCRSCPVSRQARGRFVFYNIAEWTARKGIAELITAYLTAFGSSDEVLLYIKTYGDISEQSGQAFIREQRAALNGASAEIILDYDRVSDETIACIHECGDVFATLARAEGHGIGVTEAHLRGKAVLTTAYSGPLDYLEARHPRVALVDYTLIPATFCTEWSPKHSLCRYYPHCQFFPGFVPSQQRWALADIGSAVNQMRRLFRSRGGATEVSTRSNRFSPEACGARLKESLCRRPEPLVPASLPLPPPTIETECSPSLQAWGKVVDKKKVVCLMHAIGGGNVGDESYTYILSRYFMEAGYKILLVKDFSNTDLHFDLLVIGGGGLLNNERSSPDHGLAVMTRRCRERGIPYYLVSVGFQDVSLCTTAIDPAFVEMLRGADLVCTRSVPDYRIAALALTPKLMYGLYVFPDLVYQIRQFYKTEDEGGKHLLVVIATPYLDLESQGVRRRIAEMLHDNSLELAFAEFGGEQIAPSVPKYYARYRPRIYKGMGKGSREDRIEVMFKMMSMAHTVITTRYHGVVLGRAFGAKVETFGYCNYKFLADDRSTLDKSLALRPLEMIVEAAGRSRTHHTWTEDQRNTAITKVVSHSGLSTGMIQNWTDEAIENYCLRWI